MTSSLPAAAGAAAAGAGGESARAFAGLGLSCVSNGWFVDDVVRKYMGALLSMSWLLVLLAYGRFSRFAWEERLCTARVYPATGRNRKEMDADDPYDSD